MGKNKIPSLNHIGPKRSGVVANQPLPRTNTAGPQQQVTAGQLAVHAELPEPGEYLLFPTAPLVFGTGRPLDFGLGGETLDFPFPSTVAGALRAAVQAVKGHVADPFAGPEAVHLKWLTLARTRPTLQPLFARPADAVYLNGQRTRLTPVPLPNDVYTDLPAGLQGLRLSQQLGAGKPDPAPAWWSASDMQAWLLDPDGPQPQPYPGGERGPQQSTRMHNVMGSDGQGTMEGGLFRSTGLDFGGSADHVLAVSCTAPGLHGAARRLGGEGRFVRIQEAAKPALRDAPDAMRVKLAGAKRTRCVLVTPAVFENNGWYPDWIAGVSTNDNLAAWQGHWPAEGTNATQQVTLIAAAITRAQTFSAWQPSAARPSPGPGRAWRVVPAGTVFWFDVPDGADALALWGRSLCTGDWQRDGWGRCLVGVA